MAGVDKIFVAAAIPRAANAAGFPSCTTAVIAKPLSATGR